MVENTKTRSPAGAQADTERQSKRRNRLKSLMGLRSNDPARLAVPSSGTGPSEERGADAQMRIKVVGRIYKMLTATPADGGAMVDGTPFSQSGVARLMETLRARAADDSKAGARVAAGALKFLSPKDGEPQVQGASLERLQRVAKIAESRIGAQRSRGAGR